MVILPTTISHTLTLLLPPSHTYEFHNLVVTILYSLAYKKQHNRMSGALIQTFYYCSESILHTYIKHLLVKLQCWILIASVKLYILGPSTYSVTTGMNLPHLQVNSSC